MAHSSARSILTDLASLLTPNTMHGMRRPNGVANSGHVDIGTQ
jgi:hypothetical protein